MLKKKNALFAGILALTMVGGLCSGCSSKGTASNSAAKVTLQFLSTKSENKGVLQVLADEYHEQHPNVTIQLTVPADSGTVLKTDLTKNELPDVMAMGGDSTYTEVQSAGVLADLSKESFASSIQDSYKQMVYDVQANKEKVLYGVPYATNASGILFNQDIFSKNNITVPATWDDLIADCQKLQAAGVQPFELTLKDDWTAMCIWNALVPDIMPSTYATDLSSGKATFAKDYTGVAQKFLDLLKYAQKDFMGTTYDDGNKAFAQGKAAMMINGNWAIPEFKKTTPDMNVNLFALPGTNDASKNYVTSGVDVLFAVSKQSPNVAEAKKFVAFLVQANNAQKYIDDQDAFSAVKGVSQGDKTVAGVKEDIAKGIVANFPDHYYPSGFSLSKLAQAFAQNYVGGVSSADNISQFLSKCDQEYKAAK